jgi:hypothetical protein
MLGILFGTACLIGLVKVVHHGRWSGHGHGRGRFGRRGGWMLRGVFERLETTPGQEKVILEVIDEVREAAGKARDGVHESKREVAEAFGAAHFDQEKLRDVFARFDVKAEDVKKAVMAGLGKIHEALDEGQRKEVASLLESFGRFGGGGCGPRYVSC